MTTSDGNTEVVAQKLLRAKQAVVLTGAGMSVESGVPPFRGPGGVWTKYDPAEFGHVDTFREDPAKAWILYKDILDCTLSVEPHAGHYVLAKLEKLGLVTCIVTQNVDGLHQKAGSTNVLELHGNNRELRCARCGKHCESLVYRQQTLPPRCACGGCLRPTFVLYGEVLPARVLASAQAQVANCRILLVIGTSGLVHPAASLPALAAYAGAAIAEINPEETELSGAGDWALRAPAGRVLGEIWEHLTRLMKTP